MTMNVSKESEICFLIFIGLPGSGKTTFSSYLVQHVEETVDVANIPFQCVIQICYDEIITTCNDMQWNEARRIIIRNIEDMVEQLKNCIDVKLFAKQHNLKIFMNSKVLSTRPRILIVIDDNMYYRSMRYQYYQIARTYHSSYCQLYLKCHVEECLRRNSQRNARDQIAPHIILKMAENLEEPNASVHPWEIFSTLVNSDKPFSPSSLILLYQTISKAFSHPVQPVLQNSDGMHLRTCSLNIVHQADLTLRKIIGSMIKDKKEFLNQKQIQTLSTCLNTRRQDILQEMKIGKLHPPAEIARGIKEGNPTAISALHSLLVEQFTGLDVDI